MNQLANLISANSLAGTPAADVIAWLDADVDLPHDHTLWRHVGVAEHYGDAAAEGIGAAMREAGLHIAADSYSDPGFDLSLDKTRQKLDDIAAFKPELASVCEALKARGRPKAKRYATLGLDLLPNVEQVESALAEIAVHEWAHGMWAGIVQPAIQDGKTVAEIKALIAEA